MVYAKILYSLRGKKMNFYIVIPIHNEAKFIRATILSLTSQTLKPKKILVVNDNSSDDSHKIVKKLESKFPIIKLVDHNSIDKHIPGKKVIKAFNYGLKKLDKSYDIICKFDGDLIFPKNYLLKLSSHFESDSKLGMASGLCYIEKKGQWIYENISSKNHIRGPLKAYRKDCFEAIGGLKESIGWDTIDELLALYNGWGFKTDETLIVKHLKPTTINYNIKARNLQGKALYIIRSGIILSILSALKMSFNKKQIKIFIYCMIGYYKAWKTNTNFIVTESEGLFIRKYRWKMIREKFI